MSTREGIKSLEQPLCTPCPMKSTQKYQAFFFVTDTDAHMGSRSWVRKGGRHGQSRLGKIPNITHDPEMQDRKRRHHYSSIQQTKDVALDPNRYWPGWEGRQRGSANLVEKSVIDATIVGALQALGCHYFSDLNSYHPPLLLTLP